MRVLPGEYYVTTDDEEIMTVLGSCVSVCIKDADQCVGGMNHYICPTKNDSHTQSSMEASCYGDASIDLLFKVYALNGGRIENSVVKLFGGGKVMDGNSNIGESNIKIAQQCLKEYNVNVDKADVGGNFSRKIIFSPKTGKVKMFKLSAAHNKFVDMAQSPAAQPHESINSLLYLSMLAPGFTSEDLLNIQQVSQHNNQRDKLSGLLLIKGKYILQILEGPENEVNACYKRITADKRHEIQHVYRIGGIPKREFKNWTMKVKILSDVNIKSMLMEQASIEQCFQSSAFDANAQHSYRFLKSLYAEMS